MTVGCPGSPGLTPRARVPPRGLGRVTQKTGKPRRERGSRASLRAARPVHERQTWGRELGTASPHPPPPRPPKQPPPGSVTRPPHAVSHTDHQTGKLGDLPDLAITCQTWGQGRSPDIYSVAIVQFGNIISGYVFKVCSKAYSVEQQQALPRNLEINNIEPLSFPSFF